MLNPKKINTAIVGMGLITFCFVYFCKAELSTLNLPYWIGLYAGWIISELFLLRAIGDFKYVDFSKR
ncbi:DUF3995 domain-containing protein [Algibacter miyuki]|uniref:DUF3995 domain-containing protein n=1 Tax=Algibacter miyuki TaxID=1306933 RepID=A0ABV5GZ26_9FLAO|nr:DUF3995 domain-containing protein [Algibacter miyuki]MDN3666893.1 DUF3995 domain-containing protein [Algibacter miyuki]